MRSNLLERVGTVELPTFCLQAVEDALLVNHRLYNGRELTRQEAKRAIQLYREFLRDHKAKGTPDQFTFPGRLVDRVWHTHICETRQYADDCDAYFGQFFHHASRLCDDHP